MKYSIEPACKQEFKYVLESVENAAGHYSYMFNNFYLPYLFFESVGPSISIGNASNSKSFLRNSSRFLSY